MAGRPLVMHVGPASLFNVPNVQAAYYAPGPQPNAPGESYIYPNFPQQQLIPWPNAVPSLIALANTPGVPRDRALQIDNNSTAVLPSNFLFISGFVSKSRS